MRKEGEGGGREGWYRNLKTLKKLKETTMYTPYLSKVLPCSQALICHTP